MDVMLKVKRLSEDAIIPARNNIDDAGLDLYSLEDIEICWGEKAKIHTGVAIELPFPTVGMIVDRSSMGNRGLHVLGGVIDCSYRGELMVILANVAGEETIKIKKGDRIAQLVVFPILLPVPLEAEKLNKTVRDDKAFGSSGS